MNLYFFSSCRLLRWLFRFRKRCGYGIHSPFAFNIVTGVIYENDAYYAYAHLCKLSASQTSKLRLKDNRLLFRLVNYHQPDCGLILADHVGLTKEYLHFGRLACRWQILAATVHTDLQVLLNPSQKFDFIYIDFPYLSAGLWDSLQTHICERTLVVIHGIHASKQNSRLWKQWIKDSRVRVTFDLYDFGLLYYEARLNKEDYIINYF